jgi:hypothetical protein
MAATRRGENGSIYPYETRKGLGCEHGPVPSDTTIVCAVDASRRATHVGEVTRSLAQALDAGVVLLHVFDPLMAPRRPRANSTSP